MPNVRFALAAFKPHQAEIARKMIDAERQGGQSHFRQRKLGQSRRAADRDLRGQDAELMRLADCAMSVSGSVSLELLYHTTPTVILYWISRPAYIVQGFFRKVKYITLVNLLAGRRVGGGSGRQKGSVCRVRVRRYSPKSESDPTPSRPSSPSI